MGVLVVLVVVVAVVGLVAFLRAVFGGSTFRGRRGKRKDDDGGRGDRPDSHPGASTWTGGGGLGRWNTWSGGG